MTDVHSSLLIPSYSLNKCYKEIYAIIYTNPSIVPDITNGSLLLLMAWDQEQAGWYFFFSLVSQQISCLGISFTFPCSKVQNRDQWCYLPVFNHSILGGSQKAVLLNLNLTTQKQLHSNYRASESPRERQFHLWIMFLQINLIISRGLNQIYSTKIILILKFARQ